MGYIASSNIYVFPVGTRGQNYPLARLTTEQNYVNIIRSATDNASFVITKTLGDQTPGGAGSSGSFEFIIGGYYVKTSIENLPSATTEDGTLYAYMTLAETGDTIATHMQEVISQDSTNVGAGSIADMNQVNLGDMDADTNFTGISFEWVSSGSNPGSYTYAIPLMTYKNDNYAIPEDFGYKITHASIDDEWEDLNP